MIRLARSLTVLILAVIAATPPPAHAAPEGQMTWAIHVTLAPKWIDPSETEAAITPFMVLYALHDALVKPMPAGPTTPSLAFVLRGNARFHNGEPVTAEDVKFSFERYKGGGAKLLKDRVREVQTVDARRVRFVLKDAWPDFMTFYGTTATGAGWVVPKKYVERVGDDGFKKAPVGAGPYRFVSFTPGVELVMEAFDGYWRKPPGVKRLVFSGIPNRRGTTVASASRPASPSIARRSTTPKCSGSPASPGTSCRG